MNAFIKTEYGLFKVYRNGSDWQVLGPNGFERWFSVWSQNVSASLYNALDSVPGTDRDIVIVSLS